MCVHVRIVVRVITHHVRCFTEKNCSVLNFTHTTWVKQGYSFGDVVKFTCDEGYHYDNNMMGVLECQDNSEWNGDTKGCLRMLRC